MFTLDDKNIAYFIIKPSKSDINVVESMSMCNKVCNILYSNDYTLFSLQTYNEGNNGLAYLAISPYDNNVLRKDALYLADILEIDNIPIKYKNETSLNLLKRDGSEYPATFEFYSNKIDNINYIYNGVSFQIKEEKRYFKPKAKSDLKIGMIVEFYNQNRWVSRKIENLDYEFENTYKLLIKYDKLRVEY